MASSLRQGSGMSVEQQWDYSFDVVVVGSGNGGLTAALPVAFALFLVGLASACFGTMQSTLVYATAPPAMRGRLFGLLVLCIGSGLLGFANIGWLGDLYGGAAAVRIVALEGLVPLVLVVLFWRGAFAARHR